MHLICPFCKKPQLKIQYSMELGPDGRNDENTIQAIDCYQCGLKGAAVYVECRRGSDDRWSHVGVKLANEEYGKLLLFLKSCLNLKNHKCNCEAHKSFNGKNKYGIINPLSVLIYETDSDFFIKTQ